MKQFKQLIIFCSLLIIPLLGFTEINGDELLTAEQAFPVKGVIKDGKIILTWTVQDGYYLYRKKFKFLSDSSINFDFANFKFCIAKVYSGSILTASRYSKIAFFVRPNFS